MKLIMAIVRPSKVEEAKDALSQLNISGMTISEVRGHGRQKGHTAIYRGKEYSVSLLPNMKIEIVIPDELVDETISTIIQTARTGEIGDGRVFVLPVEEGYNIRTGERASLRLVAVEYIVPFTAWTDPDPPVLHGLVFHANQTFQVWALHAWVFHHNPSGMFADWNPDVSCEEVSDAHEAGH